MLTLSGAGQPQNGVGIEERFVISVKTDNAGTSLDNQYTIPMVNSVPYDIKTSDGQTINNVINNYTITFPTPGTYEVKLSPSSIDGSISLDNNYAADKYKLINVLNWGVNNIANLNGLFSGSGIIAISAIDIPVLNNPNGGVNLHQVFGNTSSLLDVPNLELWDTSDVSSFRSSFYNSKLFSNENENTLDLSNWDTSNVNDFSYMFYMGNGKGKVDFNMGAWDIENMTQAISFYAGFNAQPISIENYNSTLISWAAQNATSNISISFGSSQYTYEAASARQTLIDTYGWTITDGGQAVAPEFALKWETTTPNEEIQIGVGDGTFDYVIDWGDGTVENYTTNDNISHTYATAGDHITKITGDFPHINMGDVGISTTFKNKLYEILNWGDIAWDSLENAFLSCSNLDFSSSIDSPNLQNCTSLYGTFRLCTSLGNVNGNNIDLSSWDVSNVTTIGEFYTAYSETMNVDLSGWVINANITFGRLVDRCNILDVTDWDVSGLTNFYNIFNESQNLQAIAGLNTWNVSNGVNFTRIFRRLYDLKSLGDLSSWSFAPNSNLTEMFFASIRDSMDQTTRNSILNLDVSNATNMQSMFSYSNITSWLNLSNWDVSGASNFNGFLSNSALTTQNYDETLISWAAQSLQSNVNISFGTSQYTLGGSAEAARNTLVNTFGWTIIDGGGILSPFEIEIDTTQTSGGSSTSNQFKLPLVSTSTINSIVEWGDGTSDTITAYDQPEVTHTYPSGGVYTIKMSGIVNGWAYNFGGDRFKAKNIKNWGVFDISVSSTFNGCGGNLTISATDAPIFSNPTVGAIFRTCYSVNNIGDLTKWDPAVSGLTSLSSLFEDCQNFNQDISGWDVSGVSDFNALFSGATSFNQDISSWNLTSSTSLERFLQKANGFNQDISSLNISTITNFVDLFERKIFNSDIGIGNWDISNVNILYRTFYNATFNVPINIENWDTSNVTTMFALFLNTNMDINLGNWDVSIVTNFNLFIDATNNWSTANYDATLIGWATSGNVANGISFNSGNAQYTLGGAAEAARNTLINTYGWTITDGGGVFVGLLDTYPNASAAYSLRDLAIASIGSAVVRVRRSSDNVEQDFTSAEITDGTLTTFTGSNDGFVTTWYDQSGNGVNATQATASNQPKLVSNGVVNLQENKPAIYYDGSDKFEFAQVDTTDSVSSIFSIVEQKENNNENVIVSGRAYGEMQLRLTSEIFAYVKSYLSLVTSMPIPSYSQNVLLTSLATSQKVDVGVNGYMIAGDTPPNITPVRQKIDTIGFAHGPDNFEGNMQEIIIYNTDQSLNKIGIETNMGNNYNLNIFPVVTGGLLSEYPGAVAAYSLRGLIEFSSPGYDINVVRVRRSNDNEERNFTAEQITDGTLTTFTGINDGFVVTWYDQSGNDNHASQVTASKQAMLVENGVVNLYNGKPSINFERSLAQRYELSSDINTVNTVSSIFSVVENKNDGFGDKVFISGGVIKAMQLRIDTTQTRFNYIKTQIAEIEFIDITLGQHLVTSFSKQQGVDLAVDGGSLQIGTTPPNLDSQKIDVIGWGANTSYFNGNIQELVIYDTDQSSNKTGIETNINTEYTIYEVPVYTDNLVASYSFDTDFSDYTGNNDLTAFGSATAGVAGGKVSDCAELDGNSDYTIAADSDDFSFTNGTNDLPFSISFWANFDSYNPSPANASWIISKRDAATKEEYQVAFLNNIFAVNLFSQGGNSAYIGKTLPFVPTTGGTTWQHFTVTYDGSNTSNGIKMYIDGISQTTTNSVGGTYLGMINGSEPVNIGSHSWGPQNGEFDGKLDEFHIWKNRELTSAEVLDIYNTENAGNSILP